MRILYVSVIEQHAGWGAEFFMDRAFRELDHQTYCVDYRKNRYKLATLFAKASPCDIFFLQRGDGFPLSFLKAVNIPRVFWASELVARCRDQDRLLTSGLFDHVFFRTQDCIDRVVSQRLLPRERASVLLSSFAPSFHRPIQNIDKDIDVLFCGTLTPRRKRMLELLCERCNVSITSGFGESLVLLLNRAKIVLNIHGDDYLDTETRVFEALGCGAFLLTERLSAENPFSSLELVQFDDLEEAVQKIEYYLRNEDERAQIARAGYVAAISGHTYVHRARQLIEVFSPIVNERHHTENFDPQLLRLSAATERICRGFASLKRISAFR